jgi:mRNA-degrading endonuclease RelE of RelBE toxin-antitoxin system
VRREVVLSPDAVRQFRRLRATERAKVRDGMDVSLANEDAASETRNRFRLRRPSDLAEFELRVDDLRVFCRIVGRQVQVVVIGRKRGNSVVIDGKRFVL